MPSYPFRNAWFYRLRLYAFALQLMLVIVVPLFVDLSYSSIPLILLLGLIPVSDLIIKRFIDAPHVGAVILFDTALITAVLFFSGGAANPFSILYLVQVVLAVVLLGPDWAWRMVLFTSLCFGSLFLLSSSGSHAHHLHGGLTLHLLGMLGAYVVVSGFVAFFLSRIVRLQEEQLETIAHLESQQRELAMMTSWTTHAAHQLGTPLSTIRLIAHELKVGFDSELAIDSDEVLGELETLERESERCREVIDSLCGEVGNLTGEKFIPCSVSEFVDFLRYRNHPLVKFCIENDPELLWLLPKRSLVIAVEALIQNALDVHRDKKLEDQVTVTFGGVNGDFRVSVRDLGTGIPFEFVDKVQSPFFTTKVNGMGLGLYIVSLTCNSLDGALSFESQSGIGNLVTMTLPLSVVQSFKVAL